MKLNTKILIVEDDIFIADYIEEMLQEAQYNNIKKTHEYEEALGYIRRECPEIIFLDINLNNAFSGIDLSNKKNEEASVIFITGQNDDRTMKKAIATHPHTYLTKPVKKMDVLAALQLAISRNETQTLSFRDGYDTVYVDYKDILFLNADGNYLHIHTISKKYTIRQTLTQTLESLPSNIFIQIHRSYIVNINKVTRKSNGKVFLNGICLPISRKHDKMSNIND